VTSCENRQLHHGLGFDQLVNPLLIIQELYSGLLLELVIIAKVTGREEFVPPPLYIFTIRVHPSLTFLEDYYVHALFFFTGPECAFRHKKARNKRHHADRLDYQPLFGKGARAPPPKARLDA